jgi:IS5 family transposase
MSRKLPDQLLLAPAEIDHQRARELEEMSAILDEIFPKVKRLVERDLCAGVDPMKGRRGLTAEQVVRVVVLKQCTGCSYGQLEFHLIDSATYRRFCRIAAFGTAPKKSTLQENVKRLSAETLEAINRALIALAKATGIESGETIRVDSTVIESNILHPTDSRLLYDVTRVLATNMKKAKKAGFGVSFVNHKRFAKKRSLAISNAKSMEERTPLYRDLVDVTNDTIEAADGAAELLRKKAQRMKEGDSRRLAESIEKKLLHFSELGRKVVDQTVRRVFNNESVPAEEKIVSIFEEHTDVIRKGGRETLYGHKATLNSGRSGLVIDCVLHEGNPPDSTQALPMVKRHKKLFKQAPKQAAFDGGYTSTENLKKLKDAKVRDVSFARRLGLKITEMVKDSRVFRQLRNFRAGIEGTISFLKRCLGLARCTWRSFKSFAAYVWASVLAGNLLVMARLRLA